MATALKQKASRGRPIDHTKRDLILDQAMELFMSKGFHATSMDEIARALRMSKLTLYTRFADKDAIFTAVIERKCQQYIPDDIFDSLDQGPIYDALYQIGIGFFSLILSRDAIHVYRMMAAEAERNPHLTKLFYDTGPRRVKKIMAQKFDHLVQDKKMIITDTQKAVDHFYSLFAGSDLYLRAVMNIGKPPSPRAIKEHALTAVYSFCTLYLKK
jgi:TetR/AcrR family transcriptional regulator, mexJK operon transcriptional repressor